MKRKNKFFLATLSSAAILLGVGASVFHASSSSNIPEAQVQVINREITRKNAHLATSGIYYDTLNELQEYIDAGTLPSWHSHYIADGYYQLFYRKMCSNGLTNSFKNYTEDQIKSYMAMYRTVYSDFKELLENLKVPVYALKQNQAVSIYFDGQFLYLITATKYVAKDTFNLQSVTINGVTYNQKEIVSSDPHLNGNGLFELTTYYLNAGPYDLQLNCSVIGEFHDCKDSGKREYVGVPLMNSYHIEGFTYNLDPIQNGVDPSRTDIELGTTYKIVAEEDRTFSFSEAPTYGKSMMKIISHAVVDIKDVECQSYYQLNNNSFNHYVWFNTDLPMDHVYRVDVSYDLDSDENKLYEFLFKNGPKNVTKTLTDEQVSGGFLNLSTFAGIEEGSFKNNRPGATEYKYQLHLNYNSNGWNLFSNPCDEGSYTNVHNFKMLRLAYTIDGEEISGDAVMDEIDGKTLNIFSRDTITNSESSIWKFKETTYETGDKIEDGINNIGQTLKDNKKPILIVLGTVTGIIVLYGLIKLFTLIGKFFKK